MGCGHSFSALRGRRAAIDAMVDDDFEGSPLSNLKLLSTRHQPPCSPTQYLVVSLPLARDTFTWSVGSIIAALAASGYCRVRALDQLSAPRFSGKKAPSFSHQSGLFYGRPGLQTSLYSFTLPRIAVHPTVPYIFFSFFSDLP